MEKCLMLSELLRKRILTLSEAEKMNRTTRVLRMVCHEFGWMPLWEPYVVPFVLKNSGKICSLYDEIKKIVEEK